ncbi:hypothetical protein Tco_1292440 [Tanacetum coccineum]
MSTSKTYQQSLADAGSKNRPPMLERGSYIPWASRFRRYLNRKRDNRKWLLKALDEGPYEFKEFVPEGSTIPRLQTAKDLEGDGLYCSLLMKMEVQVICETSERWMWGSIQNEVDSILRQNVNLLLKLGNSLQGMFMLGPKPLSVYDQQLKHGLGYPNPYTLKQAISKCPKLYVASSLGNLEIPLNVRDYEDTLEDAFKSQQKMTGKMNDPIAIANKQNCWIINYKKLNVLYKDFIPQKVLSVEQKYFPSSSIPPVKIPVSKNMPSESPLIKELDKIKICFEKLSLLIQQNCKRASIFYTSPAEIQINDFCQDQVKPILNELKVYLEFFQNLFQRDIKEMKDVFESTESELDELEKQNDLLKDQLLEASLKQDVELCVLINHECVDKILNAELEKVKKKSFEIQEGLQARIKPQFLLITLGFQRWRNLRMRTCLWILKSNL